MHALDHQLWEFELDDRFVMTIGPSTSATLLEVGWIATDDRPMIVHAMRARSKYLR